MPMQTGAVAMIDALGFKGIWNSSDVETVLKKLKTLQQSAAKHKRRRVPPKGLPGPRQTEVLDVPQVSFLSDTIVIAVPMVPKIEKMLLRHRGAFQAVMLHYAIADLAEITSEILRSALVSAPPLAYRGCISVGKYLVKNPFILGPAVDEAASCMDRAQGAFVWLAPSAEKVWEESLVRVQYGSKDAREQAGHVTTRLGLIPHRIPLKGGDAYGSHVVSPFATPFSEHDAALLQATVQNTFGLSSALDVQVKYQNTVTFLHEARKQLRAMVAQDAASEDTGSSSSDSDSESPP